MRTCPKCNYERKEIESAPEWQCPSCGIAYIKFRTKDEITAIEREALNSKKHIPFIDLHMPTWLFMLFTCLTIETIFFSILCFLSAFMVVLLLIQIHKTGETDGGPGWGMIRKDKNPILFNMCVLGGVATILIFIAMGALSI